MSHFQSLPERELGMLLQLRATHKMPSNPHLNLDLTKVSISPFSVPLRPELHFVCTAPPRPELGAPIQLCWNARQHFHEPYSDPSSRTMPHALNLATPLAQKDKSHSMHGHVHICVCACMSASACLLCARVRVPGLHMIYVFLNLTHRQILTAIMRCSGAGMTISGSPTFSSPLCRSAAAFQCCSQPSSPM